MRIARRALQSSLHAVLAAASFVALEFARVPFPVVLLLAAAVGAYLARRAASNEGVAASATPARSAQTAKVAAVGLALWLIPLLVVATTLGGASLWTAIYLFFTKAALVTFGGAYAVLGYVTSQLVDKLAWVTADQSVAGLALAETTPGPLIIVLQFMGFMAGWNQPGPLSPLGSALLAGALATWATFLPSFLFILLGAPYVERLTRNARIEGALGAITAAVVGVIATLALLLAQVVLFPGGWRAAPDWNARADRAGGVVPARARALAARTRAAARPRRAGYSCACCSSESSRCWNTSKGLAPDITSPSNSPLTTRPITNDGVDAMPLEAASAASARTTASTAGSARQRREARGIQSERACQFRIAFVAQERLVAEQRFAVFPELALLSCAARGHGRGQGERMDRQRQVARREPDLAGIDVAFAAAAARCRGRTARSTGTAGP